MCVHTYSVQVKVEAWDADLEQYTTMLQGALEGVTVQEEVTFFSCLRARPPPFCDAGSPGARYGFLLLVARLGV